jgi:hypothetical protein
MKRISIFIGVIIISYPIFGQFLTPFYPTLESNRGKGNQKLFYRLYSTNTSSVFPNTATEFDNFFGTYATFQFGSEVKLNTYKGTINTNTQKSANVLNFSGQDELKNAISRNTPYAGFGGDYFTIVVSGYFIPKQTGTYKFSIEADDACDIYINGNVVASHYGGHGADAIGTHNGSVYLIAGKKYQFRARMMENAGGEAMFLFWQKPSEINGSVWYQDTEELSSEEVLPNGLVMNIDPSNFYSYPRNGTTVNDLKGNMNGLISGNWSFNAANQGVFVSDGDQDYINIGADPLNYPTGDMSVFLWVKPTSFRDGWNIFITKWFSNTSGSGGVSDFHFAIYPSGGSYYQNLNLTNVSAKYGVTPLSINNWYYFGFTIKNGVSAQLYCNGQVDGPSVPGASRTNFTNALLFIGDPRAGNGVDFIGQMGSVQIYNRALNTEEVIQNFNATKTKYGY